jgi:hypothetical protein
MLRGDDKGGTKMDSTFSGELVREHQRELLAAAKTKRDALVR